MAKPKIDVVRELGRLLPGETLEAIMDEVADPGGKLGLGEMAKVGAAFSALGEYLTNAAKAAMVGVALHTDQEVLFKWRDPHTYQALDTKVVKKRYPPDLYPELYVDRMVAGSVSVELPFEKSIRGE